MACMILLVLDTEENTEENNGEDIDMTDDAGINRSISVDNENPQTPDENRDVISELFPTGMVSLWAFQNNQKQQCLPTRMIWNMYYIDVCRYPTEVALESEFMTRNGTESSYLNYIYQDN